jgi:uncharacterized protein
MMDRALPDDCADERVRQLTAKLLRKRLFVMLRFPRSPETARRHFADHLQWVIAAESRGEIFASGPFIAPGAAPAQPGSPAGGMTILRAPSLEAACAIVEGDPYVRHGVVDYEMREWLVMEGGFVLKISFSHGGFALD